jgi:sigma54-dependent transcription regulator
MHYPFIYLSIQSDIDRHCRNWQQKKHKKLSDLKGYSDLNVASFEEMVMYLQITVHRICHLPLLRKVPKNENVRRAIKKTINHPQNMYQNRIPISEEETFLNLAASFTFS